MMPMFKFNYKPKYMLYINVIIIEVRFVGRGCELQTGIGDLKRRAVASRNGRGRDLVQKIRRTPSFPTMN